MKLFSCIFGGQHTFIKAAKGANADETQQKCMAPSAAPCKSEPDIPGAAPATQHQESALSPEGKEQGSSEWPRIAEDEKRDLGVASELLDGLSFSTRVLGVGSYGLVLRGKFDGLDVAVKVMVTNRPDKTVRNEVNLGPSPALTHPHVCKVYATRCAPLTHALFDLLEEHRHTRLAQAAAVWGAGGWAPDQGRQGQQQQGQQGQRPELEQPPAHEAAAAGAAGARDAARARPRRRRVLMFEQRPCGQGYGTGACAAAPPPSPPPPRPPPTPPPHAAALHPLESGSPLAALHEALVRQGACVGQVVTLVVMEYLCKGHLGRAIHRGVFAACEHWNLRIARRALVRTAAEVARAMLHLHKAGVVHGDLKPANVGLTASRDDRRGFTAKVCDFGLAHVLPPGAKSLDTDSLGTPAYMAPEALMGHVGKASDVWSFGVMLWEALTRTRPYGGDVEPARLVLGIMDGSLQLTWPKLPDDPDGEFGDTGGGAAAYLARRVGCFPANTSSGACGAGFGGGRAQRGVSAFLDSCDTVATATATTATNTLTTMPTNLDLTVNGNGEDASAAPSAADPSRCATVATAAPSAAPPAAKVAEERDPVLPLLVRLGRRCTAAGPDDRPCFSEILGELIDMEIILKAGSRRAGHSSDMQDAAARARARASASSGLASAPAAPPPPPQAATAAAAAKPAIASAPPGAAAARTATRCLADELRVLVEQQLASVAAAMQASAARAVAASRAEAEAGPDMPPLSAPPPPPAPPLPPLAAATAGPAESLVSASHGSAPHTPDASEPGSALPASG